jgi:hypothetical protein
MFVQTTRPTCPFHKPHVRPIKKYSSIFEHIQGIFKEYSKNMSKMSNA